MQRPVVWPPELPPIRATSTTVVTASGYLRVSEAVAAVATLNLEGFSRSPVDAALPLQPTIALLGHIDWTAVCRQAIRVQRAMLAETGGHYRLLRRDRPWDLDVFLRHQGAADG